MKKIADMIRNVKDTASKQGGMGAQMMPNDDVPMEEREATIKASTPRPLSGGI